MTKRRDYEEPQVPPATPPALKVDADAADARELARPDGDSESDGQGDYTHPDQEAQEIREANRKLSRRDKRDGMGEAALDSLPPD